MTPISRTVPWKLIVPPNLNFDTTTLGLSRHKHQNILRAWCHWKLCFDTRGSKIGTRASKSHCDSKRQFWRSKIGVFEAQALKWVLYSTMLVKIIFGTHGFGIMTLAPNARCTCKPWFWRFDTIAFNVQTPKRHPKRMMPVKIAFSCPRLWNRDSHLKRLLCLRTLILTLQNRHSWGISSKTRS